MRPRNYSCLLVICFHKTYVRSIKKKKKRRCPMGLFGNGETKEQKQARKQQALLDKYGVGDLSDPRDAESVKTIANELVGNNLIEFGTALRGSGADIAKMTYLRAIVEQNFMIIRQLDKLNHNLENLK